MYSPKKLIFLHGFMGEKEDWDGVISHLRHYECVPIDLPGEVPQEGLLIGYSMGGRIALSYKRPSILISAHPGEKNERHSLWIERLQTLPLEQVLELWYAQPLFDTLKMKKELIANRKRRDPKVLIEMLLKYSSGTFAQAIEAQTCGIYGEEDLKYRELYTRLFPAPIGIPGCGHAVIFEDPKRCAEAIEQCIETLSM